jgi:hypothetical protein
LTPVKVFAAVTVARATTEPEGSVTVPSIAPVPPVCAFSAAGTARRANNANREKPLRTAFVNVEPDVKHV